MATIGTVKRHGRSLLFIYTCIVLVMTGAFIVALRYLHFAVPAPIKSFLQKRLTIPERLPEGRADVLYILGGSTLSTSRHIQRAATLYRQHKTDRILIFGSNTKCDYNPKLKRNLTRNEWIINKLMNKGVPPSCIGTLPVKEGFFGTLSEARAVTKYLKNKSYNSVILLSSPCHSRRVSYTFGNYLKNSNIQLYIASSHDPFLFNETIFEFIKIYVYKVVINMV